jgi:DNA polymerase-3 subunit epsilon
MYSILDIESTGGKYNEEGIMEISIYRFDGREVTDQFSSLINPERRIQPFVVKLTGINEKMLKGAPKFYELAKRIIEITEGTTIVAHNAQFDYRILRTEFRRLGYDFQRKTLCTVELSKRLIPDAESHSLGKLVRSLGIAVSDRHRAQGDALATLKLFEILLNKDQNKSILQSVIRAEEYGELSQRQLDIVENLPAEIGVYFLHNKDGEVIFTGKTKNIQKRVNQHFTNAGELALRLQKETREVTFELSGTELIALLREYQLRKKLRPRHNPIKSKPLYSYEWVQDAVQGYCALRIRKSVKKEQGLLYFPSYLAAEQSLNQWQELHNLPLRADKKYEESEFSENPEEYNKRWRKALEELRLRNKTFALVDKGRKLGEKSVILVRSGQLIGYGFTELERQINNLSILEKLLSPVKDDHNTRYLLEYHLLQKPEAKRIEFKD